MKKFRCYKVLSTDIDGVTSECYVPVHLITHYLDNALCDSVVQVTTIKDVKIYE